MKLCVLVLPQNYTLAKFQMVWLASPYLTELAEDYVQDHVFSQTCLKFPIAKVQNTVTLYIHNFFAKDENPFIFIMINKYHDS